jgi:signal transduction histidine kinase
MTRRALTPAALVLLAATSVSVAIGAAGSLHDALIAAAIVFPLGAVALLAAGRLVAWRAGIGGLRRQLAAALGIALATLIVGYALFVPAMFVSGHDALMTVLLAAYSAVIAFAVGQLLGSRVLADITRLRAALRAVGEGERDIAIASEGVDELAELTRAAQQMVTQLAFEEEGREAVDKARRDLVAAISHDLRTPITAIALLAEAIEDEMVDAATRRTYLMRLSTHVRTLAALIDDLFELSRIEAGDIRWSMDQISLGAVVDETIDAMQVHAEARGVRVLSEIPPELPPAHANPEQVQRVLSNLIQNAIRHTPADGAVTVRASVADLLEIEVSDTGVGIAADERERVFDAFFQGGQRGATRSSADGGAGLGLAIARAIVEAHGGRIWIEPGRPGTRVRFSLPLADGPSNAAPARAFA